MHVDQEPPVVDCVGVPVTACRPTVAAAEVVRLASTPRDAGVDIHLVNAYTLVMADRDPVLRRLLARACRNYPDGKSVVWANRVRHRKLAVPSDRVYGPDLLLDVARLGQVSDLRHYLLGSTPEVVHDLAVELVRRFPAIRVVGVESPPFRELTDGERSAQAERLHASRAQVIWVGLGTPKQDHEVARLAAEVPAVHVAVGAAFDFISGHKRQAPAWMGRAGLEWLFRLGAEPRRLWRRYLLGNAQFVSIWLRTPSP
jgi:N-acetylglucosaminyldiphosphoundecaprenol N-acetyl-beta-D-mannosaminyltransferase